jgi:hypothetical protein
MMIRRNTGYICLLLFIFVLLNGYGCKNEAHEGNSEGKVVYEVSYPDTLKNGPMGAMLPKEMTLYFRENKTNAEFKMGMGLITTHFMSDASEKKFSTLFKGFGKKSAMVFNEAAVKKNFLDHVDLKLVETGNTKEVAGYKCREVNVTDSTDHTYNVYYTEDVNIDSPNWCTPFKEIDGLMMEYSVKVNDIVMNLKAKSVVFEKVDSTLFTIPPDYEIISDPKKFQPF